MTKLFDFAFAVFGMFFMSEGFAAILENSAAGDPGELGSPAIRYLGILIGLFAIARLAANWRQAAGIAARSWPVWVCVGLALVSAFWCSDPGLALRRGLALVLTTLFALFLVMRFEAREFVNCLLLALLLYMVGSAVVILLVPSIGVHSAADTRFLEHVGAWRGLSAFKNDFGRIAALAGVTFAVVSFTRSSRRLLYIGATLLAIVLIAGSRSGQSIALFVFGVGVLFYVATLRHLSPRNRSAIILMTVPSLVLLYFLSDFAITLALTALGKDRSLTGRLEIWPAVIDAMRDHMLFGGGYGAGWETLVNDHMRLVLGREIRHAHNGYLSLVVEIGIFGVLVVLVFVAAVVYRTCVELVRRPNWELVLLASVLLSFYLLGNWVGSFMMKYNSVFWVLLVYFYCNLGMPAGMPLKVAQSTNALRRQGLNIARTASLGT